MSVFISFLAKLFDILVFSLEFYTSSEQKKLISHQLPMSNTLFIQFALSNQKQI